MRSSSPACAFDATGPRAQRIESRAGSHPAYLKRSPSSAVITQRCPEEFDEPFIEVIVQGEGELTFTELVAAWNERVDRRDRSFAGIAGLRYRDADGQRVANGKRQQTVDLDSFRTPDRNLIKKWHPHSRRRPPCHETCRRRRRSLETEVCDGHAFTCGGGVL